MNKENLLIELEETHEKFLAIVENLSDEELQTPISSTTTWCIKDILTHLTMVEAQLITLLWQAPRLKKPQTIHFSKEPADVIFEKWRQETKGRPIEMVMQDLASIREQTIRRIEDISDEDLTNAKKYPWLNNQPLIKWIIRETLDHQHEHEKEILAWLATLPKK